MLATSAYVHFSTNIVAAVTMVSNYHPFMLRLKIVKQRIDSLECVSWKKKKAINFTAYHTGTALIVDSYGVKSSLVTALLASFISWLQKVSDSAGVLLLFPHLRLLTHVFTEKIIYIDSGWLIRRSWADCLLNEVTRPAHQQATTNLNNQKPIEAKLHVFRSRVSFWFSVFVDQK